MACSDNLFISDSRYEYKYQLSAGQYYCVRNAIKPFMKKDQYSLANSNGRYIVRSLYFDTYNLRDYVEKINGDCDRVKLRIRTYQNSPSADMKIRAEIKVRQGIISEKYVSWIDYAAYSEFMAKHHWPELLDAVLVEFERIFLQNAMRPKIIIEYQREGYYPRDKDNLRITFDHHVRSAQASSLFPERPFFRNHPSWVVMEIKCSGNQPAWLRKIIQQNGLRIAANSKYTQGIEVARSDLVWEMWSA